MINIKSKRGDSMTDAPSVFTDFIVMLDKAWPYLLGFTFIGILKAKI